MASRLRILQDFEAENPALIVVQPRHLTHAAPRAAFAARWGFDPLADALPLLATPITRNDDPRSAQILAAIEHGINRRTALPVYVFMPQVPSVRRLVKPPQGARAAAVTPAPATAP